MPIWWPTDELVGDKVDQAKKRFEALTTNVQGMLSEPILMARARRNFDRATDDIIARGRDELDVPRKIAGARERFDQLTSGVGDVMSDLGTGLRSSLDAQAGMDETMARTSGPAPTAGQEVGPAGFTLPETGTPEGERITTALAETATRETPGASAFTAAAREAAPVGPMTADRPLENVLGMGQLALQNVGAPLPNVRGVNRLGQAIPGGQAATQTAARGVTEAIPGGEDVPRWAQDRGITRDTPVIGGLLTPDVAIPVAVGAVSDPETLTDIGRRTARAWQEYTIRSQRMGITPGAFNAPIPEENPLDRLERIRQAGDESPDLFDDDDAGQLAALQAGMERRLNDYESLSREADQTEEQLGALQEMAGWKITRPPNRGEWSMGNKRKLTDGDLHEIARRSELNIYDPDWWQSVDNETLRLYKQEVLGERSRIIPETPAKQAQRLRARAKDLRRQVKELDQRLMQDMEDQSRLEERLATKGIAPAQAAPIPESLAGDAAPSPVAAAASRLVPPGEAAPQAPTRATPGQQPLEAPTTPGQLVPPEQAAPFPSTRSTPGQQRMPGTVRIRARQPRMTGPVPPPRAPEQGRVAETAEGMRQQAVVPYRQPGERLDPPPSQHADELARLLVDNYERGVDEAGTRRTVNSILGDISGQRGVQGITEDMIDSWRQEVDWAMREVGRRTGDFGRNPPGPQGTQAQGAIIDPATGRPVAPERAPQVFPENFPPQRPPEPGVPIMERQPGMLSDQQVPGTGRVYPENIPPPAPQEPGIPIMERQPGMLSEQQVPGTGRVYPENFPDPNAPASAPTTPPPPKPPGPRAPGGASPMPDRPEQPGLAIPGVAALEDQVPNLTPGSEESVDWVQKMANVVNQARYINLLSGTASAFGDVISNTLNIPRLYWRTAVGAGIEAGFKVPAEQRATTRSQLTGLNRGWREGSVQGVKEAWDVFMHGYSRALEEQLSTARQAQGINPDLPDEEIFRGKKWLPLAFGYRVRLAADALVTNVGERMATYAMGYREADRAGLKAGTAAHTEYAENVARHVQGAMQRMRRDLKPGERVPQGGVTRRVAPPTTYAQSIPGVPGGSPGWGTTSPGGGTVRGHLGDRLDYDALGREAFAMSRDLAFQRQLGSSAESIASLRGANPFIQAVVPFFRTSARIASDMLTENPATGLIGTGIDVARSRAGRGRGPYAGPGSILSQSSSAAVLPVSQRLADHAMGTLVLSLGAAGAAAGFITGTGPTDAAVRRRMQDEGWRPLSLVVPDGQGGIKGYIPLTRIIGPHAMALGFGATLVEQKNRGEGDPPQRVIQDFILSQEGQWSMQAGLRDIYELLNMVYSPDPEEAGRTVERMLANMGGQVIPLVGLQRQAAGAVDPVQRDPRNLWERYLQDIIVTRGRIEPRTTETGEVVTRGPGETGLRAFLPFQEVGVVPSERRYYGSRDAQQDAAITNAINTVQNWFRDPEQYREPSDRQMELYNEYLGTESGQFTYARREERRRRRTRAREEEERFLGFPAFTPPTSARP